MNLENLFLLAKFFIAKKVKAESDQLTQSIGQVFGPCMKNGTYQIIRVESKHKITEKLFLSIENSNLRTAEIVGKPDRF